MGRCRKNRLNNEEPFDSPYEDLHSQEEDPDYTWSWPNDPEELKIIREIREEEQWLRGEEERKRLRLEEELLAWQRENS